jgi:Zn ribbon nucleic-acid-binding protein
MSYCNYAPCIKRVNNSNYCSIKCENNHIKDKCAQQVTQQIIQEMLLLDELLPTNNSSPPPLSRQPRSHRHAGYASRISSEELPPLVMPPAPQISPPRHSISGSVDSRSHHPSFHHQQNEDEDEITPAQPRGTLNQDRPFECEQCGARFPLKGSLVRHKNDVHLKLRPHICNICKPPVSFAQSATLRKHVSTQHFGGAKFECNECGTKFTSKYWRNNHVGKSICIKKSLQQRNAGAGLSEHPRPTPPPPSKRPRLS